MAIKLRQMTMILLMAASTMTLAACKNLGGNGEEAEKAHIKTYQEGLYDNLKKEAPLPDTNRFNKDGRWDDIGYLNETVRVKKIWAEKGSASCEASKTILDAYRRDYFSDEKIKYWENNQNCVMAREFQRQYSDAKAELAEALRYSNDQTMKAIESIKRSMIDLGIYN